ncbi:cell division protein PerM [Nocardia noduli]|uniref:cell division protein PerM n=1 Tax=Nocardia noduli TaxID=2815722 RepID=UPI001C21EC1F|nr:DUF6350 family protein [Nocardia noduli]
MSSTRNSLVRRSPGERGGPDDATGRGGDSRSRRARPTPEEHDDAGFLSLTPERARVLLFVAARPATLALTVIAVLMPAALLFADSGLDGTSGAIASGWLVAHQVPLVIGKTPLGLLPLLPTALLAWLSARDCARAVEPDSSRADLGWIVGAALSGPLLVTAVCLAVAEDASGVVALQPPNTLSAFAWVGGLYSVAATAGIANRDRRRFFALLRAPDWAVAGVYGAGRTVVRLLGCAAVVTLVSLLAHGSRFLEGYRASGNFAGVLGLTLLSLAYLPNVVIGATGILVGSGVEFGDASVGVFSVVGGPVPAVPVLAALPSGPAAGWWVVLLLIPAAVGVLGGIDAGRTSADRATAPWATLSSAGFATLALVLLGAVAGGELGTFGSVGIDLPVFAVVTFAWLALAGYAGLLFARWFVVPVGAPIAGRDLHGAYEETDYDDHDDAYYDDRHNDGDHGGDYEADEYDEHYPDDHYDEDDYYDYADHPEDDALEGELVDEQPSLPARPARPSAPPDIVDAEVVETPHDDLPPLRER